MLVLLLFCLLYYEVMCYRQRTCNEIMGYYALNLCVLQIHMLKH